MTRPTILVVADGLAVRVGLKSTLFGGGFQVELAGGIGEAETLLARSPFALVLVDLERSEPESLRFVRRLTSGHYGRPIAALVTSAAERLEARLEALRLEADFVAKPYDAGFLLDRARALTGLPIADVPGERPCRVLVIDDSATYGNAVTLELRRGGHDVVLATTASEGLKYLSLQKPQCVLLDVFLPDGDGIDIARRIREMPGRRELPLLLLTGRESATTRKRAAQAGVTAFLTKDSPLWAVAAWVWRPTQHSLQIAVQSGVYGTVAGPASPHAGDAAAAPSDLFDQLLVASGLSPVLGRSTLELALRRSGAERVGLTRQSLARSLAQIEKTLSTFLPPEVVGARMSVIAKLAQESPNVVTK
jgi:DNA-binding response OmpR family regulator